MAVGIQSIDSWLQHLPFQGPGRRPTINGPIDGVWYGVVSGLGDASAGNVALSGTLSFDRKEDWVYVLQGIDVTINALSDSEAFIQINTGPLIPTSSAVTNPTFNFGGATRAIGNNAISILAPTAGNSGPMPFKDLPIFGDKRIAGAFLMIAAGFQTNVDGATYTLSAWGHLIRYQSFFRNVSPALG